MVVVVALSALAVVAVFSVVLLEVVVVVVVAFSVLLLLGFVVFNWWTARERGNTTPNRRCKTSCKQSKAKQVLQYYNKIISMVEEKITVITICTLLTYYTLRTACRAAFQWDNYHTRSSPSRMHNPAGLKPAGIVQLMLHTNPSPHFPKILYGPPQRAPGPWPQTSQHPHGSFTIP